MKDHPNQIILVAMSTIPEITNQTRINALQWFRSLTTERRLILADTHFHKFHFELSSNEVVYIWRRVTGGEWKHLMDKANQS